MIALTVLVNLFLIWKRIDAAASILIAPSSVATPLYTLVNFTCEGTGNKLSWTVQANPLTDPSNQDREISVTTYNISVDVWSSVLTIKALPINDGITVQCNVISYNPLDLKQKGATLTVKGISSVNDLDLDFTDKPFVTWSSPSFYSNDIPRENIATYHVIVQSQDCFVIADVNTTDTFYQLPCNITDCDIYTASVTAFIEQYSSLVITTTEQYTGNYTIDILEHVVEFEKSGNSSIVEVQFPVNIGCSPHLCDSTIYGITKDNVNNETIVHHSVYIQNVSDINEATVYYNITGLYPSLNYTFTAYIMDLYKNTNNKAEVIFSIYNVQKLTLQYYSDNGSVVVECRFAERSIADGCHVIFRESSIGTVKSINMSKSSIEESTVYQYITLPVSGNYTVTAYDIVDDTIITNPSVVYPQVLEYILLIPSPTETVITTSTTSSVVKVSDITSLTYMLESTLKSTPSFTVNNRSNWIVIVGVCGGVMFVIIILVISLVVGRYCYSIKKKQKSSKLNRDRGLTHCPQSDNNNDADVPQLTNVNTTDPYHISPDKLHNITRQHQQSTVPPQKPSQPIISPVIPHQAKTTPEFSPTTTKQTRHFMASEISCIGENDLLLPNPGPSLSNNGESFNFGITSQNKKINTSSTHDVQETSFTDNEQSISQMVGKEHCIENSSFAKPISSTHTGHYTDSGISMSGRMSSTISKEGTSVSVIPESNNEDTSQREVTTCQYPEIGFASPHLTAPSTSDDVPVQYSVICGHLNTMISEDKSEFGVDVNVQQLPMVQNNEGNSRFVNISSQRPQGMDYVHNTIVKTVIEYEYSSSPVLFSDTGTVSCIVNNKLPSTSTSEENNETRGVIPTTSHQEEVFGSLHYFNTKSKLVAPNPSQCSHQFTPNKNDASIENEPDNIDKFEENSTPQLVCAVPKLINTSDIVINSYDHRTTCEHEFDSNLIPNPDVHLLPSHVVNPNSSVICVLSDRKDNQELCLQRLTQIFGTLLRQWLRK